MDKYVLVIASWYPNKSNKYNGDFNQRHVFSVAPFVKQVVVYVGKDESGKINKIEKTIQLPHINIEEHIVLYRLKQ